MEIHPDKTAARAVDACGGTYITEQKANGYADGHFEALDAAMMAVRPVDALMAEMMAALTEARTTLSIIRTQVMVEVGRCADPRESRWEGVPEKLKERLDLTDAVIAKATKA